MRKQKLVIKEEVLGNVESVQDGKVVLEGGKVVKFDPEVHELKEADKVIAPWQPPDYHVIPEINRVVELPDADKPLKVLSEESSAAVADQFADSHTAFEQSNANLAVPVPNAPVDIKAREQAKDEESKRLAAEAEADKDKAGKKGNK